MPLYGWNDKHIPATIFPTTCNIYFVGHGLQIFLDSRCVYAYRLGQSSDGDTKSCHKHIQNPSGVRTAENDALPVVPIPLSPAFLEALREASFGSFLVERRQVFPRLLHDLDHMVERHAVLAVGKSRIEV